MTSLIPNASKGQTISSLDWNNVINAMQLVYSIYSTVENYLAQIKQYIQQNPLANLNNINNLLNQIYDYLQSPTLVSTYPDYISSIPTASPGMQLTADIMNIMTHGVTKLYNSLMPEPAPELPTVFSDEVVKSDHWNKVVNAINQLLTFYQSLLFIVPGIVEYIGNGEEVLVPVGRQLPSFVPFFIVNASGTIGILQNLEGVTSTIQDLIIFDYQGEVDIGNSISINNLYVGGLSS